MYLTCCLGLKDLDEEEDDNEDGVGHQVDDPNLGRYQVPLPLKERMSQDTQVIILNYFRKFIIPPFYHLVQYNVFVNKKQSF